MALFLFNALIVLHTPFPCKRLVMVSCLPDETAREVSMMGLHIVFRGPFASLDKKGGNMRE